MILTEEEILILQDLTGNASLVLRQLHRSIKKETPDEVIMDLLVLGKKLEKTGQAIYDSHNKLAFLRRNR